MGESPATGGDMGGSSSQGGVGGFYNRSSHDDIKKTVIPDVYAHRNMASASSATSLDASVEGQDASSEVDEAQETIITLQDRVLVGTLFSISRSSRGEMFPLYLGRNSIGSDESCDIRLLETTVSPKHSVLLVRSVEVSEGNFQTTVSLTDYDSEYGTLVNGESLGYDKVVCHDHDILSFGLHYQFLLCLFDKAQYRLQVSDEFSPIHIEKKKQVPMGADAYERDPDNPAENPTMALPDYSVMAKRSKSFNPYAHSTDDGNDHSGHETILGN